ncbi:MAG: adenylate/guanylate cyclase domain-containing protein [Chthoniobacter sp.]|uniref:adenylate/guanylate cyclase domain-containing protein n=1 Tax=Chthoniobacter sp. TaxID=2510640 RepID=UPI0032AC2039
MSDSATLAPDRLATLRDHLRTPTARLLDHAQKLQLHAEDLGQEVFLPELYKIQSAGKHLLEIVDELVGPWAATIDDIDFARLRFEVRGSLNHTVGYIEMLQERADELEQRGFLPDLEAMRADCRQLVDVSKAPPPAAPTPAAPTAPSRLPASSASTATEEPPAAGTLLVVDDNVQSRNHLGRELQRQGYRVVHAGSGPSAMERLRADTFDLVILDVIMPGMSGYEMLQWLKADPKLQDTPVIMISAMSEIEHVVRCLVIGADDYITKPFEPVLLNVRIGVCLERHRWRQQEQKYLRQLEEERILSERLLLNILPKPVAARLRQGEDVIVDALPDVTLLAVQVLPFPPTDAASTTPAAAATEMVALLNDIFTTFDPLAQQWEVEKIKTHGHTYLAACGLFPPQPDHAYTVVDLALALQRAIATLAATRQRPLHLRIGIHTGPVIAGLIGLHKFSYDLWGDTVHFATHLATTAPPDRIQVSPATETILRDRHRFEPHELEIPGQGLTTSYLLFTDPPSV